VTDDNACSPRSLISQPFLSLPRHEAAWRASAARSIQVGARRTLRVPIGRLRPLAVSERLDAQVVRRIPTRCVHSGCITSVEPSVRSVIARWIANRRIRAAGREGY
jgi:hypothetical protein